jgi:hypothetical protein
MNIGYFIPFGHLLQIHTAGTGLGAGEGYKGELFQLSPSSLPSPYSNKS